MATKLYQLFCEICSWKKITDGSDVQELFVLETSPILTAAPKIDEKGTTPAKFQKQIKRFRCEGCGRVVKARVISDPQTILEEKLEAEKRQEQRIVEEAKIKEEQKLRYEQSQFARNKEGIAHRWKISEKPTGRIERGNNQVPTESRLPELQRPPDSQDNQASSRASKPIFLGPRSPE